MTTTTKDIDPDHICDDSCDSIDEDDSPDSSPDSCRHFEERPVPGGEPGDQLDLPLPPVDERTAKVIELTHLINQARKSEEELAQEAEEDRQMCANEMKYACHEIIKNLHDYASIFERVSGKADSLTKEQLDQVAKVFVEAAQIFGQFSNGPSKEILETCLNAEELKEFDEHLSTMRHVVDENFHAQFRVGLNLNELDRESGVHSSAPPSNEKQSHG